MKGLKIVIATAALVLDQQLNAQAIELTMSKNHIDILACFDDKPELIMQEGTNEIFSTLDKDECITVNEYVDLPGKITLKTETGRTDLYIKAEIGDKELIVKYQELRKTIWNSSH